MMDLTELLTLEKTKRFQVHSVLTLYEAGWRCLTNYNVEEKARVTLIYCDAWKQGIIQTIFPPAEHLQTLPCPDKPARPVSAFIGDKEKLDEEYVHQVTNDIRLASAVLSDEKRQKVKNLMRKMTLEFSIHGIANAESYAIDLFWDIIIRFQAETKHLAREFFDDMVYIAEQESQHFTAWKNRLQELGFNFGEFPLQDGLWQSAGETSEDILARLSVINLTHEAKGLDSYHKSREKFVSSNDQHSIQIIDKNYQEEIGHVKFGVKWFKIICARRGVQPIEEFHRLSRLYFKGKLREPFNREARDIAGLTEEWYMPLT